MPDDTIEFRRKAEACRLLAADENMSADRSALWLGFADYWEKRAVEAEKHLGPT